MSISKILGTNTESLYPVVSPDLNLDFTNNKSIDPAYTFTRNSSGTYIDADGYIKTAGVNQPRFDHDPLTGKCKGLLVEENRKNYILYSQEIQNSYWATPNPVAYIPTVTANVAIAPDGTLTGSLVNFDAAAMASAGKTQQRRMNYFEPNFTESGTRVAVSYFIKKGTLSSASFFVNAVFPPYPRITYDFDTDTLSANTSDTNALDNLTRTFYPNGWVRISATTNRRSAYQLAAFAGGNVTGSTYYWGIQLEVGASASSYIPTTTSAVTRQPDQLVLNNAPISNQGTFFIESNPTTGTPFIADNGSSLLSITQDYDTFFKSALYYNTNRTLKMSSDNSIPLEVDNTTSNLNRISLGFNKLTNQSYINGHIKKFSYYASPLTENNLRAITGNKVPVNRNESGIVTDSLVTYLDAISPLSYSEGTTWNDLTSSDVDANLIGGPTYNDLYGGNLIFNGVDQYAQFTNSNNYYAETVIVWAKSNTSVWTGSGSGAGFGVLSSSRRKNGHSLHTEAQSRSITIYVFLNGSDSDFNLYHSAGSFAPDDIQIPHMYAYSTNGLDSHKGYLDGKVVVNSTTTIDRDPSTVQRNWQMGRADFPPQARYGNVTFYAVKKYNRQLTDEEIQQNFNALRGRFGI